MYVELDSNLLFRVGSATHGRLWPNPVEGHGAFYVPAAGNRYSRPHQLTVYCSDDPWVAISEAAFYQSLKWQNDIASSKIHSMQYPLRTELLLWAFSIDPAPTIIDLLDTQARRQFDYTPQILYNPLRVYRACQDVADAMRAYIPNQSTGEQPAEGIKVPSVRTKFSPRAEPFQLVLFVKNTPLNPPLTRRATLHAKMKIEFEFFPHGSKTPVAYNDGRINWNAPKFRLSPLSNEPSLSPSVLATFQARTQQLSVNRWMKIQIIP